MCLNERYSNVRIGKHLSDNFLIQNGRKQGDWYSGGGVHLGPLGTAATNRPIVPSPGDFDDGEIGGIMIGKGNRSTWKKPASVPLCSPQTPHAARNRSRAAAVGNQRLTALATARPKRRRCFISIAFEVCFGIYH
jgi:hypothetical protein